jgi:DNA (cytosine-5)-methyltransferase 1
MIHRNRHHATNSGGFPCQPFSNLSHQPGFKCEKGRGLLFQEIVRVLNYSQPKAFLVENVPGLLDMKDAFDHITSSFEKAGYYVHSEVCNARAVTATTRKRLFFVGLRKDLHPDGSTFQFPFVPDLKYTAADILDYDELPPEELTLLRLSEDAMNQLITGRRWRPHSLAWPNRPLDTITSHYGNAVGRGDSQLVPCHAPHNPRRFSPRECARLMGFPNTYRIPQHLQKEHQGDMAYRKQFYRMFGNAVCPPIIAALAGAVLDHCALPSPAAEDGSGGGGGGKIGDQQWTEKGLDVAIALSLAATRSKPVAQPMGCLAPPPKG